MAEDAGWTTILSKSKSKPKQNRRYDPTTPTSNNGKSPTAIPRPDPNLTLPRLHTTHSQLRSKFLKSSCYSSLTSLIPRLLNQSDTPRIETAYCLGTGSFSRENVEQRARSLLQFVVFEELVALVRSCQGKRDGGGDGNGGGGDGDGGEGEVKMYASEPRYTGLDVRFLSERGGVDVVDQVENFGKDALVCDFFVEWRVGFLQRFLDDGVGMIVGSMRVDGKALSEGIEKLAGREGLSEEEKYLVVNERFCRKFDAWYFPRYEEEPNTLEGLKIAVRKLVDEDESKS